MMSSMGGKNIHTLSIYPDNKASDLSEQGKTDTTWKSTSVKSVGMTTMSLVTEVKDKYNSTLKKIENLKNYVTSTEGKVKLSVMFLGFSGGCALAYRSKSTSRFYKRFLPASTLAIAASACYPYTAWEVAKTFYHGSVVVTSSSAKAISYVYHSISDKKEEEVVPKDEEKELVYTIDERGVVDRTEESKVPEIKLNNTNTTDKPISDVTIVKLLPPSLNPDQSLNSLTVTKPDSSLGDFGQGSPEDKDLYTTRS